MSFIDFCEEYREEILDHCQSEDDFLSTAYSMYSEFTRRQK